MQRQIFNSHRRLQGNFASRFGALLAMTGLLLLSACGGGGNSVTDNNLGEPPFKDGVPPTLTSVSIRESTKSAKPGGFVQAGKSARVDIVASESLMKPIVTINDVEAEVIGKANGWYAVRKMTEADTLGEVYFSIVYQDISGELGVPVSATTDGSALIYCDNDTIKCPEPVSLPGDWRLDVVGGAGLGPAPGDTQWWNTDIEGVVEIRACWFDDVYRFGADGSFQNILGDETWLEDWQAGSEQCGAPLAPHDGSTTGTWEYDEVAGTLTITGVGLHIGLPRTVNGGDLPGVPVPDSVVYDVLALEGDSMTIAIETLPDNWWTYRLARKPLSPLAGKWRLDKNGGAGLGPAPGSGEWWNTDIEGVVDLRACWFDDIYEFGADGSFRNTLGDETWLEVWQAGAEQCGAPLAPHDGSNGAIYQYDEDAGTLKLTGEGAHIGLPRTVNGGDLPDVPVPESVTYDVLTLDGDSFTVAIQTLPDNWWTYKLERVSNSPVVGKWKLATEGGAGLGPAPGSGEWWNTDIEGVVDLRSCWFDDIYHFGDDGSFQNYLGDETWLEVWQAGAEQCGAPIAPHDGSTAGSWDYDEAGAKLTLNGAGQHIGLPRTVNGGDLPDVPVPESVIYDVLTLDGDTITVAIQTLPDNWWTYKLERVNDTAALAGKWRLNTSGGAALGPAPGSGEWWNTDIEGVVDLRACWFDDVVDFGADGSFENIQGDETWLEPWQIGSETCGVPLAPHDGSARAIFEYDEAAGTLTVHGTGAHLGLPRTVNGGDLSAPGDAPDSVTYDVLTLDGDDITVAIETLPDNWWTYKYVRVSNSPLVGNWKLATEGGAGLGPAPGDGQWWNTDIEGVVEARACWFDDVFHFGAGGTFQNFQDGETWLEDWQAGAEQCGAPIAPHDGSTVGVWRNDDAAGTLTISGVGSHIGLPRTVNGGDLPVVEVPESITYDVLSFDLGEMTIAIETLPDNWWTYKLARE